MSKSLKEKLETIKYLANECLVELGSAAPVKTKLQSSASEKKEENTGTNIVLQIVNKIGNCEETDLIQKHILDQHAAEGRVLMPLYISYKYFNNTWLTSGDISKITSDLGVKIANPNVSNYLITYRRYLESKAMRKKGQPTPCRMNRAGAKRFEEIINEKIQ